MHSRKKIRYYEPDGSGISSEEGEIWRRLGAVSDAKPISDLEDSLLIPETFDALNLAKVELQSLKDLFERLESQKGLGVTYIPDSRTPEEFRLNQRQEKLIKAEQKQTQMKEAAEVLTQIHSKLDTKAQNERTFYRELMGLAHFHKVHCEPTALSPFCVDLSMQNRLISAPLIVELQVDGNGHVMLSEDLAQPSRSEVIAMLEQVESNHDQIMQNVSGIEEMRVSLLGDYRKLKDAEDAMKRQMTTMNRPDQSKKRTRNPDKPSSSGAVLEESKSIEDSEKTLMLQKVMSLEFDPEDKELLVSGEESENDEESDDLSEDPSSSSSPSSSDAELKERWFTKDELFEVTKVHMALTALQVQHLWGLCTKTLNSQVSVSSLQPKQRTRFAKAMDLMNSTKNDFFGSVLRAEIFSFFINSIYRLPPFLEKVDIRDLKLSHTEKVLLLTKSSLEGELESPLIRERLSTNEEGVEDWLKQLEPKEFFEMKFKHTAPDLTELLYHFLGLVEHEETLKRNVLQSLKALVGVSIQFDRAPGINASKLWIEISNRFRGWILIDGKQIQIIGTKLNNTQKTFISEKLQSNQFHSWLSDVTVE